MQSLPHKGGRPDRAGGLGASRAARYGEGVAGKDVHVVEASGRSVEISSPDKVYFPAIGATKLDLV